MRSLGSAGQAQLLLGLLACLLFVGCGEQAAEPLSFGPAPWADGEEATYDLVGGDGEPFGVVVYGIERRDEGWTMTRTLRTAGAETVRTVEAGPDLAPVRSTHVSGKTRKEASFREDVVERRTTEDGADKDTEQQPRRIDMVESTQLLQLVRTLPLAVGFEKRVASFSTSSGGPFLITVRVQGTGTVTVPAGSFEAWQVELDLGAARRTLWYGRDELRLLLAEEPASGRRGQRLRSFRRSKDGAPEGSDEPSPGASTPARQINWLLALTILLVQLPLMIVLPFWLGLRLRKKLGVPMKVWGIGALAFVISQVVHLPLNWALGLLGGTPRGLALLPLPLLAVALGLSAGLCEGLARYGAMRWLLKEHRGWSSGVQCGAGHGGIEAILLGVLAGAGLLGLIIAPRLEATTPEVVMALAQQWHTPWYLSVLAGLERVGALIFHIGVSVLVMRAVTRRRLGYLVVAIGVHTLFDGLSVALSVTLGQALTEAFVFIFAAVMLWLVLRLREPTATSPAPVVVVGLQL